MEEDEKIESFYKHMDQHKRNVDTYRPFIDEMEDTSTADPIEDDDKDAHRLSLQARDDIYDLYIFFYFFLNFFYVFSYQKGWSIKDLCTRYGIIPERVKAVIWCCEKFYNHILPKADPVAINLSYEMEEEWEMEVFI